VVEVIPGQAPEPAPPGSVLVGKAEQPLTEKVGTIAAESEQTMQRIQDLLSQETVSGIEASVEQLRALLTELAATVNSQRSDLEQTTRNMRIAAQNTKKLTSAPELEQSIKRLQSITTKLDDASGSLDRASRSMEVVLVRIERGEGTLGRLSTDDTLYRNANQALMNLNQTATVVRMLAIDLQANPKRYVNLSLF
jgi:phospholipid/cholesterol/gamma-HCH transport system substrate-binding protein